MGFAEQEIADSYFEAGNLLVESVLGGRGATGREMLHPVMYLYRHGIELFLKCIVRPRERNHDLARLLEKFCEHSRERYKEEVPAWFISPIREFIEHDPRSTTFRFENVSLHDELWIDLLNLRKSIKLLRYAFRRVIVADATGQILPRGAMGELVANPRWSR